MKSIIFLGKIILGMGFLLVFCLMALTVNAQTSFQDGTFNDADWTVTIQTLINGGTVIVSQSASGGNANEFRRIVNTVYAGDGSGVWGFHIKRNAVYDPSTQGAILSIDYTEDSVIFAGGFGDGQATGPALLQDENFYFLYSLFANQNTWTTQSLHSLTEKDFRALSDPNIHPDFSLNGSPITFGFYRANSTVGNGYSTEAGIDNWSVTINSVNDFIAYWSFDNCDAADESGNGYDGTVYGNPECEDGINGLALRFDGVNDHIQLNQTLDTNVVKAFSFWINSYGVDGVNNFGTVLGKYNWNDRRNFLIGSHGNKDNLDSNYIRAYFYTYGDSYEIGDFLISYYENPENLDTQKYTIIKNTKLEINKWKHVVVNMTSEEIEIWIDGQITNKVRRDYQEYYNDNEPTYIGNIFNADEGANNRLNGSLDEFRIYSRQLNETEIQALYDERRAHLNEGLVAYYPFNGNANDESGNGNHGTAFGATLTEDRFGNPNSAYSFDGTDDYIEVNDAPLLNITNSITLSSWIKPYSLDTNGAIISKTETCNSAANYDLSIISDGKPEFIYWDGTGLDNDYITNSAIIEDTWHHVVATYNYSTYEIKIYVDGVLINSDWYDSNIPDNPTPVTTQNKLSLGARLVFNAVGSCSSYNVGDPIRLFNGAIDEVRIYNRTLSEAEVQELYGISTPFTTIDETFFGTPAIVGINPIVQGQSAVIGFDFFPNGNAITTPNSVAGAPSLFISDPLTVAFEAIGVRMGANDVAISQPSAPSGAGVISEPNALASESNLPFAELIEIEFTNSTPAAGIWVSDGPTNDVSVSFYNTDNNLITTLDATNDQGRVFLGIEYTQGISRMSISTSGNDDYFVDDLYFISPVTFIPSENLVINGGFETTVNTSGGLPTDYGYWQGDMTEIVTASQGITPFEGSQMLRFNHTPWYGWPNNDGVNSVLFQIIDISRYSSVISTGQAFASASARFNRVSGDSQTDTEFAISISTFKGSPDTFPSQGFHSELPYIDRYMYSDDNPNTWEVLNAELLLPADIDFLVIRISANENIYNDASGVEFDGHYADAVTLSITTDYEDTQGPEISNVNLDGTPLVNGATLRNSGTFTLNATDPSGVSRVEFYFDGSLYQTDYNGTPYYDCLWNILPVADGNHTLTFTAYDTLNNNSTVDYSLVVALDSPPAPVITEPVTGGLVNTQNISVSGNAEKNTEVILYNNGIQFGEPITVDNDGHFTLTLTLTEGQNRIQTAARNRAGTGPLSAEVIITLDTTLPQSPMNLSAQSKAGGLIRLTWQQPLETSVSGYNIYRSTTTFTSSSEAVKVNTNPITGTSFDDIPSTDGLYFYRLSTVDTANNESGLSELTSANSDRAPPEALSIQYLPTGSYDPTTGRTAPGRVDLTLTVSEQLLTTPFLSITPEGGIPISVELSKESETTYTGFFVISDNTPSGTAYAVFSARDLVGNRGTEIQSGRSIAVDTAGPVVTRITIQPDQPIHNDQNNPVSVTVTIGLNSAMKPGETPELSYLLSGEGSSPIPVGTLTQVTSQPGEAQTWQGTFTFPIDAGLPEAETFQFIYRGVDDLDNVNTTILSENHFQVYQGELPPLETPTGLKGESLPDGQIRLSWNEVEGAAGYQLFRKAPDESVLTAYERPGTVLEYSDTPSVDGLYTYAVASIRQENNQEAISGMSTPVEVLSDSTPPEAPGNLVLTLVGAGIQAQWEAVPDTEPVTYSLYRSSLAEITTVEGLTPVLTDVMETTVIDPHPSSTDHSYVVTAVDRAGNESLPSNSFYLNFELLPVSTLQVVQSENESPVVSWSASGSNIAGYNFYIGSGSQKVKLNESPLTALSYADTGYAGDERLYTVTAVDDNGVESVGRSITLPILQATLQEGAQVKRGVMNRLEYHVENQSSTRIENIRLKVRADNHDHSSETFNLDAHGSAMIPVIVGGYDDLPNVSSLITTIEIAPHEGEKVEIIRTEEIEVGDGTLIAGILNEEFTRGGTGKVQFTLENTGGADIEIITARNHGASPSGEIIFYLNDADENVLSSLAFQQNLGEHVVTLGNGDTVARIPAGTTFTSAPIELPVPLSAPDDITIRLDIAHIHYHYGNDDQVSMDGLSTTHPISLIDTSYYGEVLTITPESSSGDEDIVITGRAVERSTSASLPGVPLDLVISVKGFDRTYPIFTNNEGTFSFTFTPLSGESGVYTVRVVHPDLQDRPVQGQFVINRISINPTTINLSLPRNYEKTVNIQVTAGNGTSVNNLRLVYEALEQPEGAFPEGIYVVTGAPITTLNSGQTASLDFTLWADNSADDTGTIVLSIKSDETGNEAWGTVIVNTHFSDAQPVLFFTPDHLEIGIALDGTAIETIVLENRGLATMNDVSLSIVSQDGTPAPEWVHLNAAPDQGELAIGEQREISISFNPTAAVTEGFYSYYLRVSSSNYPTTDISLFVSITQSGIGSALFKVVDIYTATHDQNGDLIQGLTGATIEVQNEEVLTFQQKLTTDNLGEALFTDLPAGRYKCRVRADNHQEYIGRLWVKPGITVSKEVFLTYNLVTVEWEVTETTIEDRYEVVLHATYETDVPAAVVVAEPASITLPDMKTGDVFYGEFTLTNYGLIRADNLQFELPPDNQYFKYELLTGLPDSMEAKERITVPYKVICLQSLAQEENQGTGGGIRFSPGCIHICYLYKCMYVSGGQPWYEERCTTFCYLLRSYGKQDLVSISAGANPPPRYYEEGKPGKSTWHRPSGPGNTPNIIDGVICWPVAKLKEIFFNLDILKWLKETWQDISQEVGCTVNCLLREFNDDAVDLSVKVPGGSIVIKRWFYQDKWHWEHLRNNLVFKRDELGIIESIEKGGVIYDSPVYNIYSKTLVIAPVIPWFYTHDTYKISVLESGYRWEDKVGNWKEYDQTGRMTAYGTRKGSVGKLLYEAGENGRLNGIADRNNRQVIWFEYNPDGQISAVRDNVNRQVDYHYTNGLLTKIIEHPDSETNYETIYEYDNKGRITKKVDAEGRPTEATYYESNGYVTKMEVKDRNGKGHVFQFDYDDGKKEYYAQIKTSSGRIKEVWYDRDGDTKRVAINGRIIRKIDKDGRNLNITDEKGNITRKKFDEWDNLTEIIYPDDSVVSFDYEHTYNQLTQLTDPRGNITEFNYDDLGNLDRKTEAIGTESERVTTYSYYNQGQGQLHTVTIGDDANTVSATTTFLYDENDNIFSISDSEGNITEFPEYDTMGNPLNMKDPRSYEWSFTYDTVGRLISQTAPEPLNYITRYEYNGANNRTAMVQSDNANALSRRFAFEYDDHNNMTKAVGPDEKYKEIKYNTDNLPEKMIDEDGKVTSFEYDNEGRLRKYIDGAGSEIIYHYDETQATSASSYKPVRIEYPTFTRRLYYDEMQRVKRITEILDESTTYTTVYEYDRAGNIETIADKEGNIIEYEYDKLNRLVKITDPLKGVMVYTYDDRDNLISLQDPNNGITRYEYDRTNRLRKVIRPMGEETVYGYDAMGNRTEVLDAKGQKIAYKYDALNRLEYVRHFEDGDHENPVKTVHFTYNYLGSLESYDDGTTSATYEYDALQRKTQETINYGPFTLSYAYTYYDNGLKKTFTGPDGVIIHEYVYDDNNRLNSIGVEGQWQLVHNTYQWNSPEKITLPGGTTQEYTYDPLMQMESIAVNDPDQNPLMAYSYEYSPSGNIQSKSTEHEDYSYQYDTLYRLTEAINPATPDEAYTYDAVGNRKTSAGVGGQWDYNENNELLSYDDFSFEHDNNGNMIQKIAGAQVTNYFYNVEDRLAHVEDGSGSVIAEYYYDPFGRRLWKDVGGTKTYFFYSDEGLIGEYDANGNEIKAYGYRPHSTWTTDPLYQKIGEKYYWYQNDHLGTPQKIVNTGGRTVWSATYDAFGNIQIGTAQIENNLRFPGQYYDAETESYYNWNRYYDPVIGRYLSVDPFVDGLNLYVFAENNSINLIDPWGLCPFNAAHVPPWYDIKGRFEYLRGLGEYLIESPGKHWVLAGLAKTAIDVLDIFGSGPWIAAQEFGGVWGDPSAGIGQRIEKTLFVTIEAGNLMSGVSKFFTSAKTLQSFKWGTVMGKAVSRSGYRILVKPRLQQLISINRLMTWNKRLSRTRKTFEKIEDILDIHENIQKVEEALRRTYNY